MTLSILALDQHPPPPQPQPTVWWCGESLCWAMWWWEATLYSWLCMPPEVGAISLMTTLDIYVAREAMQTHHGRRGGGCICLTGPTALRDVLVLATKCHHFLLIFNPVSAPWLRETIYVPLCLCFEPFPFLFFFFPSFPPFFFSTWQHQNIAEYSKSISWAWPLASVKYRAYAKSIYV